MKKLATLLFLTFYVFSFLQSQNLGTESLFNFGTKGWESVSAMTSDSDGNYYVAGTFSEELNINGTKLTSLGQRDIFLVKYNSDDIFQWAKSYGGQWDDHVYSMTCDPSGNLYLAGSFQGTVDLGSTQLTAQTFTDVFYTQIDNNGQMLAPKSLASQAASQKVIIQTDTVGNIWIAGSFEKTIEIDATTTLQAGSGSDIFFAKYGPGGNLLLYKQISGDEDENLNAFVLDNQSSMYIGGSYTTNMEFGSNTVANNGKLDMFVAKYDSTGSPVWYQTAGDTQDDQLKSIALDNQGSIYCIGDFTNSIEFDSLYNAPKFKDVFLLKQTGTDGSILWSNQLSGNSYNTANSIIATNSGYIYVSGNFTGELQSGGSPVISKGKSVDAFIVRYKADGTKDWTNGIGGVWEDKLLLSYNSPKNKIFTYGYFSENLELLNKSLSAKNYKDVFISPIVDCDNQPKVNLGNDTSLCSGSEIIAEGEFVEFQWSDTQTTANRPVLQAGTYTVIVTDQFGCSSSDDIDITILSPPVIDLGPDTSFCEGGSLLLDAGAGFNSYLWENNDTISQRTITESGTYSLQVTNELGCANSDTIFINTNPLPVVDLGEPELWVPKNTTFTLSTPGTFISYLWNTGDTTSSITLESRLFRRAAYVNLSVIDYNGCSGYDEVLIHEGDPPASSVNNSFVEGDMVNGSDVQEEENTEVSIDEQNFAEYKIFPNPHDGKFFIGLPKLEIVRQIDIFDSRGNHIKTFKNIEINLLEIDVSSYAKGLYLIYISEETISREFKIIYN